jgi:CTP:molybdopterin cytidylyltransferase MocA
MSCTVVILAAQRAGVVNPLAERAGVSHKCLAPIHGKALIVRVMDTVAAARGVGRVRISVEPEARGELDVLLAPYRARGMAIDYTDPSANIATSLLDAVEGQSGPYMVTTADNVLMSVESFEQTLGVLAEADIAFNLSSKAAVHGVHPDAQRRFYAFRDDDYSNCNLYGIAGSHALSAVEIFREGGQFMKNPGRLITAFGLFNILLFRFKLLTAESAARRLGKRFGLKTRALILADGTQAVDVDNERTFGVAEMVLKQREPAA